MWHHALAVEVFRGTFKEVYRGYVGIYRIIHGFQRSLGFSQNQGYLFLGSL